MASQLSATTSSLPVSPLPIPPLHISTKSITQVYLGRSAAWFGAEHYWRSYEDATKALTLQQQLQCSTAIDCYA